MIHATARIEEGVTIGAGTAIWDHVHVRHSSSIGERCIIGEKTYIAYDVQIGNLCKIHSFVFIASGVTIEDGVFVGPSTVFTNDRYPRAAEPDLSGLLASDAPPDMPRTVVREGASLGSNCTVAPGITIGRWAMVGMGSVVTKPVDDFHLAMGNPAVPVGVVCRCGLALGRFATGLISPLRCPQCGRSYNVNGRSVSENATTL